MTTNLFIIIVTYNGMPWLSKCLKSCESYEVIVIDNNSSDGTVAFIEKGFPEVILLQQDTNLGFGAANNIGMSYALKKGADYVFLLNQDAYLKPNTLERLIRIHKRYTNFGLLSPIHLSGDGTRLDYNFSKYIRETKELQHDISNHLYTQEVYELPFVNAAAWLLPRSTIEMIGGFDPIFHHYGEDVNYCQRVLYHHLTIGVVPEAHVLHDREFRPRKDLKSHAEKLAHYERGLKQALANINLDMEKDITIKKQILIKQFLKSCFKLMFYDALFNLRKYRLLKEMLPAIRRSREKNKDVGLNYIDVND